METFFKKIGMTNLKYKPAFNPYTEPSLEIFAYHPMLKRWVEIGNSGIFRPEMLEPMGFEKDVSVIAWGLSLERPTMIYYGVDNIRDMVGSKVKSNPVYLAGGIAMFPLLRDLKGKLKPERYGGAPLLGLTGLVMKAHGSSNRQGIASAIRLGLEALGHGAGHRMLTSLAEANAVISSTPEEA